MKKTRKKVPTKARKAKPRRRRPPRDERAALLSDLARRVTRLGKTRIDEIREMYDAAYAEAQGQLKRRRDLRARFHTATEILKSAFALDAIEESQRAADLQLAIAAAVATVTNEGDLLSAQVEIGRAFEVWREHARARDRARKHRLADVLAAHGLAAPKTRTDLDAMLAEAAREVATVKADEARLRSWATEERALVTEWTKKARLARNIGEEDLATQADARVAQYERQASEWESELKNQTAALAKLEGQLTELRRAVTER